MIDLLANFGDDEFVCLMYYSTSGWSCPEHGARSSFYGVSGVPDAYFSGYLNSLGGMGSGSMYDNYLPLVNQILATTSLLEMSLDMTIDAGTITVSGTIEALDAVVVDPDALVYVAVYEEDSGREPNLARGFPVWEEVLTAVETGQTQNISGTLAVGDGWNEANLHAIMFVQAQPVPPDVRATMIVTGPGPGPDNVCRVAAWDPANPTGSAGTAFSAYGVDKYGVNVAVGDVTGDGFDNFLTGPGPGAVFGPQVRGFDYEGDQLTGLSYFAYGTLKYGVNVAAGDLDNDGVDEILTGAGPGAVFGPHVRGWSYNGSSVSSIPGISYFAYGTPKFGVNVVCGDIDGDGFDEIITGAGPGAVYGPHVRGWNYDGSALSSIPSVSFLAYNTNKYGVNVACGDIDGDGMDELITGAGPGAVFGPHLRGWNIDGGAVTSISAINTMVFDYTQWGVNVGCGDVDRDGMDEIFVGAGPGETHDAWVRGFNFDGGTLTMEYDFTAYGAPEITHGVNVTCGTFFAP